jgi:hypothetical protein
MSSLERPRVVGSPIELTIGTFVIDAGARGQIPRDLHRMSTLVTNYLHLSNKYIGSLSKYMCA